MPNPKKMQRHVEFEVEKWADWLKRLGRKPKPTEQMVHEVKKAKLKGQDVLGDVASQIKQFGKNLRTEIDDILEDENPDVDVVRELEKGAKQIVHEVKATLKHPEKMAKEVKSALTWLKEVVLTAISKIGDFFRNLATPGQKKPHPMLPISGHQKGTAHLANESQLKAHEFHGTKQIANQNRRLNTRRSGKS